MWKLFDFGHFAHIVLPNFNVAALTTKPFIRFSLKDFDR